MPELPEVTQVSTNGGPYWCQNAIELLESLCERRETETRKRLAALEAREANGGGSGGDRDTFGEMLRRARSAETAVAQQRQRAETAERERDEARDEITVHVETAKKWHAEARRLREYARHKDECVVFDYTTPPPGSCTCGLTEALASTRNRYAWGCDGGGV